MEWNAIRTKILAALVTCLIAGVGGIMALMHYGFEGNSQVLAAESVSGAQKLFTILESREMSKMRAVSETLIMNPQVRDAFAAKDRSRLLALTAPLYSKLKGEGITNWMLHTPEPDMSVFLRLYNPQKKATPATVIRLQGESFARLGPPLHQPSQPSRGPSFQRCRVGGRYPLHLWADWH
jgi:hypothetical protein